MSNWEIFTGDRRHSEERLGSQNQYGFRATTLTGGKRENVQVVTLDCGDLSIDVLPTRGMGIWKARRGQSEFGWHSPVRGPVHPSFVPLSDPSGLGWLEGFDEMMVRCGLESNGAPEHDERGVLRYGVHGKIANSPAADVMVTCDETNGWISVSGVVEEARFLFYHLRLETTIRLHLDSNQISVTDRIVNCGGTPTSTQVLYHNNFGPPVLSKGSRFVAPVKQIAPRDARATLGIDRWDQFGEPETGFAEQVCFMELFADQKNQTAAMLHNEAMDTGVSVGFNTEQLPCFTLWKNTAALSDGYVCGLEPATNFPNGKTFEEKQDRVVWLDPDQSYQIDLTLGLLTSKNEVVAAADRICGLQQKSPLINEGPKSDWS